MSKFKTFMKATGEVLDSLAQAQYAARRAPIDNVVTAAQNIDWDAPRANTVLYGLTTEEIQKLREVEYILNRFPRK